MARILVVDDEAVLEVVFREMLEPAGHEITYANCLAAARPLLATGRFELAFVDKNMPDGSGLELAREIRKANPDGEFVLMTAYGTIDSAVEAMHVGAFDYLTKPFPDVGRIATVAQHAFERIRLRAEQRRLQARLAESEARYARVVEGTHDGIWDWDLSTGDVFYSPRWRDMMGIPPETADGSIELWFRHVHEDDLPGLKAAVERHLSGNSPRFQCEYRMAHPDGMRWMLARGRSVRDDAGAAVRLAGSQSDVTERRRMEEQLLHDATHDALTGLHNRALLLDRLAQSLARAKRHPEYQFAVLHLDLDRFKLVNDGLGHPIGDQLLIASADRLRTCVRTNDTVARLGGDEFAVLLDAVEGREGAEHVASRIQEELARPFSVDDYDVFGGASIGIAMARPDYVASEDLLRDADTAMYRAKAQGGNAWVLFDPNMHTRAVELLKLHSALRGAVERNEFRLHYQPVIGLLDGRIEGFEALVRWIHPQRGMVSPAEFIPVAEETGLIIPIGRWILEDALRRLAAWQALPGGEGLCMSVNVSGKQLRDGDLVPTLRGLLQETGVAPATVCLELTESILMENVEHASRVITELKTLGVQFHLDDFGTGFSSLSYLHRFPFDKLKIDRSFVRDLPHDRRHAGIIRAVMGLAETMGIQVVAEGIETEEQAEALRALGCRHGQGFLYSRPVEHDRAEALLQGGALRAASSG